MNAKYTVSAIALAIASSSAAFAQNESAPPPGETGYTRPLLAAPAKALELTVGTGYTQGFGSLQKDVSMSDVITPGVSVDAGIGYRIDPHWYVGLAAQYQEFSAQRSTSARGGTGGLAIAYHMAPYNRVDPWIQFGTGYRILWENHNDTNAPQLMTHGFEPIKLTLGLDVRASEGLAIAPVIGGDLTVPVWQSVGDGASVAIVDPRPSAFVFAGIQARFDAGGKRMPPQPPVQTTQATVAPPPAKPASPSIAIGEDVLEACKMNVDKSPHFDFDKSDLLPEDLPVLAKIAECFSTGPMKGQGVQLIGRADPRGSVAYNDALGMRRAAAVAAFLEGKGVGHERIEQLSRGKRDATGTDEASWANDRRVDVAPVEIHLSVSSRR
jgi:peptidoglycan-associated lipoprotein